MRPALLGFTVFVCGAIVMIFEIIGSRIVSPFIGTSTYVWTSLIGVILGALSLGYWLGGRAADRDPSVRVLAFAIFLAGGLVSFTILVKDVVLSTIGSWALALEIKSLLAALLLFAPASVALGFVTPYAVRLNLTSVEKAGETVGRLYALSTIGSIFGTFAAGFFLVPFIGSIRTLYLIAACLIAVSLMLAPFAFTRFNFTVITLFVLAVGGSEFTAYMLYREKSLIDFDTAYSRVRLFQTVDPESGRQFQAMATDPYFVQSALFLDGDDPVFKYSRYYRLLPYFRPRLRQTLMIGGAGFTFPMEYLRSYPLAAIDVVEIDPAMTDIARRYFRLRDALRLKVINEDGRTFLNTAPTGKYDALLMDAFGSLFSVPYQLTTIEAVRQMSRVLTVNGVVIFNLGSSIRGRGSRFFEAELRTYRQVFATVRVFKVNPDYKDERLQNLIIVACKTECGNTPAPSDTESVRLLDTEYKGEISTGLPVLTDDLAPVEYYNSTAQNLFQESRSVAR